MKRFAIAALIAVSVFPVLRAQQAVPEIPFDSVPNFFKLPADLNFGEDAGVALNSKGHVFVYTRSNSATGAAYGGAASRGRSRTSSGSTRTTTSGPWTRGRTW